jgi:hypothetical protein
MQLMEITSWNTFKELVSAKGLLIQYTQVSNYYDIYAPESPFLWHVVLVQDGGTDQTDFETNYKSSANQPLEYRSVDGLPKFASAMFVDNLSYWVDGSNGILTVASGQTGYVRTNFSTNFSLNGVDIHWAGANLGDYVNFEVGVYNNNDTSSENNFIQLAQFANKYRVLNEGTKTFNVDTVKTVPATYNGLTVYIRTTYANVGSNSVNLCVNLLGYK